MFDELAAALAAFDPEPTPVELADALWLAGFLPAGGLVDGADAENAPSRRVQPPPVGDDPADAGRTAATSSTVEDDSTGRGEPVRAAGMFLPHPSVAGVLQVAVRSPAVAALPGALDISRALRPLSRTEPSAVQLRLDEQRTAELTAEAGLWLPVQQPVPDRWLDLALVVDASDSMSVWRRTVAELRTLLVRLGAFRDVRVWRVDGDAGPGQLRLRPEGSPERSPERSADRNPERGSNRGSDGGSAGGAGHHPRELLDPTGRRVVLVVSDCIGEAWSNGAFAGWLELWGTAAPVAIVQPLPQRLWDRCAPEFVRVRMRADRPAASTREVKVKLRAGEQPAAAVGLGVPVFELEARWLAGWAALVTAQRPDWIDGTVLFTGRRSGTADPPVQPPNDAQELVAAFRATASPTARRLAGYLAAAPLNLPVMRLVQAVMLPGTRPSHLAEVFLSGLLRQVGPHRRHPDEVEYDFRDGVRELLLPTLKRAESLRILREVSRFVGARMGSPLDFPALLAAEPEQLRTVTGTEYRPFARVAYTVLHVMGGRYRTLAETLKPRMIDDSVDESGTMEQPPSTRGDSSAGDSKSGEAMVRTEDQQLPVRAGVQPAIWGGVPMRNPNFTGREELLRDLRQMLTGTMTALLPHTLHGLGGVGKTQLAVEYAHRYASSYDIVWWIPAELPALVRSSLVALGQRLGIPASEDVTQTVAAVLEALRVGVPYPRWLLVFDNADSPEELAQFLPYPAGDILITSRNQTWSSAANTLEVNVFQRPESVALLKRRGRDITDEEADRLADKLGDLPLALEQAAAWHAETGMPVDEYLALFDERVSELLAEARPTQYPTPVAVTWGLAFDRLRAQAPAAVQLLELCAFFGAEPISVKILPAGRFASLPAPLSDIVDEEVLLRRAVREVGRFGLARVDPSADTIQVHRLVQAVLRERLTLDKRTAYQAAVQRLLSAANPGDPTNDQSGWTRHAQLGPHILASGALNGATPDVRKVVLDQIRYLYVIGDYHSSLELGLLAWRQWQEMLGEDDQQTLITARFVGNAMRAVGRVAEAREINAAAYELTRRALGEQHEHTLSIANSVGGDYRLMGKFSEAYELDSQTFAAHQRIFRDDDPSTLRSANNLAVDLRLLGRFREAYERDRDTLRRRILALGDEHPDTLFSKAAVSRDLYGLGDYAGALQLQEVALAAHRRRVDGYHSNLLRASWIHTVTLRKLGRVADAQALAEDILTKFRSRFGDSHHDTIGVTMSLANILRAAGQFEQARVRGEDALAKYRKVLGDDHPFTMSCAVNLAVILRAMGEYADALTMNERAVIGLRAAFGEEHPYTLAAMSNQSNDLAMVPNRRAALELSEYTLLLLEQVCGPTHSHTLACANNLALGLRAVGREEEASALKAQTLAKFRRVFGMDHPESAAAKADRRIDCDIEPPPP